MSQADHTWKPTSYNPNILPSLGTKSAEEYAKTVAPFNERLQSHPHTSIEFARRFESGYKEALATLNNLDPQGVVLEAFQGAPIAPCIILERSNFQSDNLGACKFGGVPDFRRKLSFRIKHAQAMLQYHGHTPPTNVELLQELWPKDANGDFMMFVAQIIMPPTITMPWNYFMGELMSEYKDFYYPFSGFHRGSLDNWNQGYYIFRSSMAPFFDPRLDCAMIYDKWPSDDTETELLLSEQEYLSLVKEAIPQVCPTEDDEDVRWSSECQLVTDFHIGFEFDIPLEWEWPGVPKIDDGLLDGLCESVYVGGYNNPAKLFGAPESQQTPHRFFIPSVHARPRVMTPWLSFDDDERDFTWQLNFCQLDKINNCTWGKVDGSCT